MRNFYTEIKKIENVKLKTKISTFKREISNFQHNNLQFKKQNSCQVSNKKLLVVNASFQLFHLLNAKCHETSTFKPKFRDLNAKL